MFIDQGCFHKVTCDLNLEARTAVSHVEGEMRVPTKYNENLGRCKFAQDKRRRVCFLICLRSTEVLVTVRMRGGSALGFGQEDPSSSL